MKGKRPEMDQTLTKLLNLPDTVVQSFEQTPEGLLLHICLGREQAVCPRCLKWTPLSRPKIGQDKQSRTFPHPLWAPILPRHRSAPAQASGTPKPGAADHDCRTRNNLPGLSPALAHSGTL